MKENNRTKCGNKWSSTECGVAYHHVKINSIRYILQTLVILNGGDSYFFLCKKYLAIPWLLWMSECYWHLAYETKDAAKHPTILGAIITKRTFLVQQVSCPKVEKKKSLNINQQK